MPHSRRVDVVVIGGSTHAVEAALSARAAAAKVLLVARRTYLGEDLCATLRLTLPEGRAPATDLARRIYADSRSPTPLHVKKTLDSACLQAGVDVILCSYVTDVLLDARDEPCGVGLAHRAGRQTVIAGQIVDATDRGWVARLAGARPADWPDGPVTFERTVLTAGDEGQPAAAVHSLPLDLPDGSFRSMALAEQVARDRTYVGGQLRASDSLFFVPPDPIVGVARPDAGNADGEPSLDAFRAADVPHVWVLSGSADVPRDVARDLLEPTGLCAVARRVGAQAARNAVARPDPSPVGEAQPASADRGARAGGGAPAGDPGPVKPLQSGSLPIVDEYDVVVVGGGTSGAPAAIAAARQGASVLLVEYQAGLGGVGTLGLIGKAYHGRAEGFAGEVPFPDDDTNVEDKMEWYRLQLRQAGAEIWFGAISSGAAVQDGRVTGVVIATPAGRCVARAKVVIDATGNADVAVAAGAKSRYGATEDGQIALQGTGLPARPLGASYVNTDYLLVDESDPRDVTRALVGARMTLRGFDAGTLIQTRERRRIVGEHTLSYLDQIVGRTFPDTIVVSASDYDSHGYPNDVYFALLPHTPETLRANHPAPGGRCCTPYRCLIPHRLEGILVVGLAISMHRDASAMVRMQHDLANQGYAAGVAAAMAARAGCGVREIDLRALQRHLVETGALPAGVLNHRDNVPFSDEAVARAVADVVHDDRDTVCGALAIVLSHRDRATEGLRARFAETYGPAKLTYAKLLGVLGDARGADLLADALRDAPWDDRIKQGNMAEYAHLPTPTDALVLALGFAKATDALPVIARRLAELDADSPLSHHRSIALALEAMGDPAAADPLAALLAKPRMTGHAMTRPEPLHDKRRAARRREGALREIILARALYRCGDRDGLAERILRSYRRDLRGLLARHARYVLGEVDGEPGPWQRPRR